MKTNIRHVVSLFLIFMSALPLQAQKRSLPICVLDATEQPWYSGAPGGYSGTSYSIQVYINTRQPVELEYLWISKEPLAFNIEMMNLEIDKKPELGDTILLTHRKVYGLKDTSPPLKPLPINHKGAGLIQCRVDGKTRYFIISKIRRLPTLQGQ